MKKPKQHTTIEEANSGINQNTRIVSAHVDREMYRQLRIIAAEEEVGMQEVIAMACNALFVKAGKPEVPFTPGTSSRKPPGRTPAA